MSISSSPRQPLVSSTSTPNSPLAPASHQRSASASYPRPSDSGAPSSPGPSSSRLAQSQPASSSAPSRRSHARERSSLGSGTHLLGAHRRGESSGGGGGGDGDLGGWTLEDAEARRARERKGKGRGNGYATGGIAESDEEGEGEGEGDQVDEEAEAARIAAHLASWSRTERQRRATLRKETKLVMPSPPVTSAQLSSLSRSASQLARRPSQAARAAREKRRRSKSFTQVIDDEDPDADPALRGRSMRLLDRRRSQSGGSGSGSGSPSPVPPVPDRFLAGFESGYGEVRTPTEEVPVQAGTKKPGLAPIFTGPAPPNHHPTPPHSAVSDTSTVVNPFTSPTKSIHHQSRFFEDLPPQSPVKDRQPDLPTPTSATPAAPFFATDATASHHSLDNLIRPSLSSPPQPSPGVYSTHDPFTDLEAESIPTPTAASFASALNGSAQPARSQPSAAATMRGWGAADDRGYGEGGSLNAQEEEERDDDHRDTVGILDWLLCGCFRGAGDREGAQAGRTNPME